MLSFKWPYLFLCLPLPLLTWALLPRLNSARFSALRVPFYAQLVASLTQQGTLSARRSSLPLVMAAITWVLLITAAARPYWSGDPVQLPAEGRDLMLAVDVSNSMEHEDLTVRGNQVNRLEAVKSVLNPFISRRENDRIGLILFGSNAYLHAPLTFDRETVRTFLNESAIGIAGPQTAMGDAIGMAVKRLQERSNPSRILVLLTDGANTAGKIEPLQAAELAKKIGLKVYTIGVGASEMKIDGPFGGLFGSRRINPSADLDETTLKAIANTTGGFYFRAEDTEALHQIYEKLDQLEPIKLDVELLRPQKSLLHWPLGTALLLSLFSSLFYSRSSTP